MDKSEIHDLVSETVNEHLIKLKFYDFIDEIENKLKCKIELDLEFSLGVKLKYDELSKYLKIESEKINIKR